jgi:hypothetical protein
MRQATGWLLLPSLVFFLGCGGAGQGPPAKTVVPVPITPVQATTVPEPTIPTRMWTSADARVQIRASFMKLDGKTVWLRRRNGEVFTATLDELSQADRDWIESQED